jgi:hypothetical protein
MTCLYIHRSGFRRGKQWCNDMAEISIICKVMTNGESITMRLKCRSCVPIFGCSISSNRFTCYDSTSIDQDSDEGDNGAMISSNRLTCHVSTSIDQDADEGDNGAMMTWWRRYWLFVKLWRMVSRSPCGWSVVAFQFPAVRYPIFGYSILSNRLTCHVGTSIDQDLDEGGNGTMMWRRYRLSVKLWRMVIRAFDII